MGIVYREALTDRSVMRRSLAFFTAASRISPCCEYDPEESLGKDYDEIWNSEHLRKMRIAHYNHDYDNLPSGCIRCIKNPTSHRDFYEIPDRQFFRDIYEEHLSGFHPDTGIMDTMPISYLALGISNLCNFACRMCGSGLSNTFYRKYDSLGILGDIPGYTTFLPHDRFRVDNDTDYIGLIRRTKDTLREVVIHGGDPSQEPRLQMILDELVPNP